MKTNNTLMVRDMNGNIYPSNNGDMNPKTFWVIMFLILFLIFEYINFKYLR